MRHNDHDLDLSISAANRYKRGQANNREESNRHSRCKGEKVVKTQDTNQDAIDGDILDAAIAVLVRRNIARYVEHELRGHSRKISGSRECVNVASIAGTDIVTFEQVMSSKLSVLNIQYSTVSSYANTVDRTTIWYKLTAREKKSDQEYKTILGAIYHQINTTTNLNPEDVSIFGD